MTSPRIFVGTLECGEAEFEECRAAIQGQLGVIVTHMVISNQPELEAHNQLWSAWATHKHDHDLMVKVDADTVLSRPTALKEISDLFDDPAVTGAQILLHDYFTDQLIAGLNAFSPVVEFKHSKSRLYADHADSNHGVVLKGDVVSHLAPIGWHCVAPHPRQAFHYGLHRELKKQRDVIRRCARAWLKNRDDARSWALIGAMAAGWRLRRHFDYGDKRFETAFQKFEAKGERESIVEDYAKTLV